MRPRKKVVLYIRDEELRSNLKFILQTRLPVTVSCCNSLQEMHSHFSGMDAYSSELLILDAGTVFHLSDLGLEGIITTIEIGTDKPNNYYTSSFYVCRKDEDWIRLLLETYMIASPKKRGPKKGLVPRHKKERTRRLPETVQVSPILNGQSVH